MPSFTLRARLGLGFGLSGLALALACGGGTSSSTSSSSAPPPAPPTAQAVQGPDPFWSDDSPSRPHRAHPLHTPGAPGSVISLSGAQLADLRASSDPGPSVSRPLATPAAASTVPLRVVTGLYSFTYHQDSATTLQPRDLTTTPIQVLVPNSGGGFDTLTGQGNSDGTFSISNVPVGYYWLKFGRSYLWTNVDHVQWVLDSYGRPDVVYPGTSPTNLQMTVTDLNAWQGTDELFWAVPNQGYSYSTFGLSGITNAPNPGDTALTNYTMDFVQVGLPLLDATKGDQGYVTQLTSRVASGQTFRALGKVFTLPATTMTDGAPAVANGGFLDISQSSTVRLNWKRSALAAMTSSVNPTATVGTTEFGLWVSPLGTSVGVPLEAFQIFTYDSGDVGATTDLDLGDLAYGNPFPSAWTTLAETYFIWNVSYLAPGATTPVVMGRSAYTATTTLPTAATPIAPLLSPIQNPKINGKSLFENQVGVGLTPSISWDAPSTGAPTGYVVSVYPLVNTGGVSSFQARTTFRTVARSFTLPPGVLASGSTYVITISAVRNPGYSYASNPFQSAFPYATSPMASAIVAP